jgi:hypothetical protein
MSARSRVHVHQTQRLIAHVFQDMGMPTDKQARLQSAQFLRRSPVVVARISTDVGHVDLQAVTLPGEILFQFRSQIRAIDISEDSTYGPECTQLLQHSQRPEVASVPEFIAIGKLPKYFVVEKAMCVGKQPDPQASS